MFFGWDLNVYHYFCMFILHSKGLLKLGLKFRSSEFDWNIWLVLEAAYLWIFKRGTSFPGGKKRFGLVIFYCRLYRNYAILSLHRVKFAKAVMFCELKASHHRCFFVVIMLINSIFTFILKLKQFMIKTYIKMIIFNLSRSKKVKNLKGKSYIAITQIVMLCSSYI